MTTGIVSFPAILLAFKQDPAVAEQVGVYARIRIPGLFAQALLCCCSKTLQAMGLDSKSLAAMGLDMKLLQDAAKNPTAAAMMTGGLDPKLLQSMGLDAKSLQAMGMDPKMLQSFGMDPKMLQSLGMDPKMLAAMGLDAKTPNAAYNTPWASNMQNLPELELNTKRKCKNISRKNC